MKIFHFTSYLVLISSSIISFFVFYKGRKDQDSLLLSFFCFMAAIWGLGAVIFSGASSESVAVLGRRIANIGVIFTPVLYYHFIYSFFKPEGKAHKTLLYLIYGVALVCLGLDLFAPEKVFVGGMKYVFNEFYYSDWFVHKSYVYLGFYVTFYLGVLNYTFMVLIKNYLNSKGLLKVQLRYFILGSLVGWMGPSLMWLIEFRIYLYPYANILLILYPIIWAYAIIKYNLLDIKVAITRVGIFLTLYTVVLGVPFYVGFTTKSWPLSTALAVLLATMGPLIYRILQSKAEDILLSEQRRYQKILIQAASGMTKEHSLDRLLKLIVRIVKKAVKMEYAAIFIEDKEKGIYTMRSIKTDTPVKETIVYKFDSPLVEFMKKNKEPFLLEEIPPEVRKTIDFPLNISLIVPSFYDDSSIGFLVLGEKLNSKAYSTDDINVFRILSKQTSMSIENCIFVEEFQKAQEKVFAAEKLASIGGLAEGVAHQINNRLNHFSMVAGELKYEVDSFIEGRKGCLDNDPELKKTFDYFVKISDALLGNVHKTDSILKGILNYARVEAKETMFSNFFLQEVVDLSLELLKVKHGLQEFPLEIDKSSSDIVYGIKSQLMESVYNLLDNAYEATLDKAGTLDDAEMMKYKPAIQLSINQYEDRSLIKFTDNGIGIKDTDKYKIFAPFFTTKSSTKSGTGIGMYVVKRMIEENHKGRIWFESEYGKGTTTTVELPKKRAESA